MSESQSVYQLKVGDAIFTFGDECPQIKSIFFPNDKKETEVEKETGDQDDSSQPS